jgi:putative transposase
LLEKIREVINTSPFYGEGHRKVWARLRFAEVRTSKARVLRLMRAAQLLAPSRTLAKAENPHTGTIITARPNEVWASVHTMTVTVEDGAATVFVAADHCTTECMGLHAAKKATRFEALEPLRQAVRDYCGGFRAGAAEGIRNRHDHGSQYMSDDYQTEIAFLGMESSPSFVRQPECKDYASHCTSWVRCDTTSLAMRRCDSFMPWAFRGGLSPGCSYRQWFLSLQA